jgi:tetratricopeptide (TPR) repeat protein
MKFLDKITDKIADKIEERLGTDEQYEPPMTLAEEVQSDSEKNYEKHHVEIDKLNQRLKEIYNTDDYPEQNNDIIDCCFEILELDSSNFHAQMDLILPLARTGKTESALNTCKILLELYPNDPTLENLMGDIFFYSGNHDNAILYYDGVIQKTPYTDDQALKAKQWKAHSLYMSDRYDEAIEFCSEQLGLHENDKVLTHIKISSLESRQNLNDNTKKYDELIQQVDDASEQIDSENNQNEGNTSDSFIADELSKLAKLKEQGVIDDDEFKQMKQKLMKKM